MNLLPRGVGTGVCPTLMRSLKLLSAASEFCFMIDVVALLTSFSSSRSLICGVILSSCQNAIKFPSHQALRQGLYSANLECAVVAVSSKSQCIQVLPKSLLGAGQFSRLPEPLLLHGCFDGLSHVCNALQHELHRPACCVSPQRRRISHFEHCQQQFCLA